MQFQTNKKNKRLAELEKAIENLEAEKRAADLAKSESQLNNLERQITAVTEERDKEREVNLRRIKQMEQQDSIRFMTAIEEAQAQDHMVISITNVVASSIARLTNMGIYQHAGPEISVASSKAFTSQLTILIMLAIYIGRKHNLSKVQAKRYISQLRKLPALVEKTLDVCTKCKTLSSKWAAMPSCKFLGRQLMYPIAIEGALKLKELAYVECHGYPAGELKHGPLAAVGYHAMCMYLAPQKELFEKNVSTMKEIKARDSHIIAITQEGLDFPEDTYDNILYLPKSPDYLQPILAVIPLQFFSMYMAQQHQYNVDRPRHLAKSVTVE